jgi:electron transfer flavoprotein alpha subunit
MPGILVFLEHHGNELQKGSLGVLAKAAQLGGGDVAVVLVGADVKTLAAEAGTYGATTVHVAEDASLEPPLPQARVDVLAKVVQDGGYDTVLFANSVLAADVAAGLAARLDAGLNWDLADISLQDGVLVGKRPALQDSILADVGWKSEPRLALFRSGSFDATPTGGGAPQIAEVAVELEEHSRRSSTNSSRSRAARRSKTPTSSSPAAEASAHPTSSRSQKSSPARSAARSARRAQSSTQAGIHTQRRSGRPARPSRRSSTSRSAFPARSSTRSACRAPT